MSVAKERIFRTLDGKFVSESDPDALFLVAGEGCEIPGEFDVPAKFIAGKESVKQSEPAANKEASKAANKSK